MKIAINTLAHRSTGGGITYLENVLPRLAIDDNQYIIFVPAGRDILQKYSNRFRNISVKEIEFPVHNAPLLVIFEQLILPVYLSRLDIDLLFSPADVTPLLAPCPAVLAIRNPNPYFSLSEFSLWDRVKFRVQKGLTWLSARRAEQVFFVSEFSRDICNEFLELPEDKVAVLYHGIDEDFMRNASPPSDSEVKSLVEEQEYILCVSTVREHKNFETLLTGYAELPDPLRDEYTLLIAGRTVSPEYFEKLQRVAHRLGINEEVSFVGEIPYTEIAYLYNHASAYVLPSTLETFGHTLVEAMAAGLPIVAAETTAIPEIAGDAALYFDADDFAELAEQLTTVLTDTEARAELRDAGADRSTDFSWDRNVQKLRELFGRAISKH